MNLELTLAQYTLKTEYLLLEGGVNSILKDVKCTHSKMTSGNSSQVLEMNVKESLYASSRINISTPSEMSQLVGKGSNLLTVAHQVRTKVPI